MGQRKIFLYILFSFTAVLQACSKTHITHVDNLAVIPTTTALNFVASSTLTAIRPNQKWQYTAQGGTPTYTFDLFSGTGVATSAGLFTAPVATSGSSSVRVTDSAGAQVTTSVLTSIPLFTMAYRTFLISGEPQGALVDSGGINGDYQNEENSYFLIRGDTAHSPITLTFDSFNVESGYDHFRVYDGDTVAGTLLADYDGVAIPAPVTATSGNMLVQFTSDGGDFFAGFLAHWATTPTALSLTHLNSIAIDVSKDENLTVTGGVGPFTYSVVSGGGTITKSLTDPFVAVFHAPATAGTTVVRVTDALNHTYDESLKIVPVFTNCTDTSSTSSTGVLYDSGGPSANYADYSDCGFVITPTSPASGIQLKFDYILIENGPDLIYVYDGTNASGTLLATYTSVFPAVSTLTATSGSLYIRFTSDSATNYQGFRAIWKVIP